nr:MAG TPA: hypothetical protein [Caudoviricetes sp.]DAU34702.1 MAG TPA: hypothetical protein [Caudoviricetes sp.]
MLRPILRFLASTYSATVTIAHKIILRVKRRLNAVVLVGDI